MNKEMNDYLIKYFKQLNKSIEELYFNDKFVMIIEALRECWKNKKTVFVAGNGGSASIASHFATDWSKGLFLSNKNQHKTIDISSNISLLTASANDLSYENSFANIFNMYFSDGDIVLAISSSGESRNIMNLIRAANHLKVTTCGLSGNGESSLFKESKICISTKTNDTQIIEDSHSIFGHLVFKHLISI